MWKKLGQKIWEWRAIFTCASGAAGIVIALRVAGMLQPLSWTALDLFFRLRPSEPADPRIAIVGISEADLKKVGQWPIPDAVLAQLLEKIKAQKPRAIGLDLYRDLPVQPGHEALVKVFKSTPNLIGIEKILGADNGFAVAAPPVLGQLEQVGANDLVADADGKLRRGMLYLLGKDDRPQASFGMKLALIYLKAEGIFPQPAKTNPNYLQLGDSAFQKFAPDDGDYVGADDGGYQILLNYRGKAGSFNTVSMTDVLEDRVPPDLIRDRIVFIGVTAVSLNDFFYTPYSTSLSATPERTPGVEIQATTASQIVSSALDARPLIETWSEPQELAWILFWSFTGATLTWTLRNVAGFTKLLPGGTAISLLFAGTVLVGVSYYTFLGGWWIPVVPPMLTLLGSATAVTAYIASVERSDRQTVMNLFGRHVTPKIAEAIWRDRDQLLKEGRLPGRKMTATVIFTDLKGFSTTAETIDPEALMSWLNEYMDTMSQIVLKHGGIIDKFIGDAIMAIFGVPIPSTTEEAIALDAVSAVSCASAMATALKSLNEQWLIQGRPITAMRVGIATGEVVAGSLGSQQRLDYTTIGDTVNVAARLESYRKELDGGICRILINEETYQHIKGKFTTKLIGHEQLKGREQQTAVYQVLLD